MFDFDMMVADFKSVIDQFVKAIQELIVKYLGMIAPLD